MSDSPEKPNPIAVIPWVIALLALIGCNVLAPQKVTLRKAGHLGGSSFTQVENEAQPLDSFSGGLACLAAVSDVPEMGSLPGFRVGIEKPWCEPEGARRSGEVRGRAPPEERIS